MILEVRPTGALRFRGTLRLPASKSYSIRAFLIAACGGVSRIRHPSDCDDAKVAMRVARQLGAHVAESRSGLWRVRAQTHPPRLSSIHVQESGTVLRFVLPLAVLYGRSVVVDGKGTLRGRPNRFLTETLRKRGVAIRGTGTEESIPIRIRGGTLRPGKIRINGSLSSQFISALLIACPHLDGPSRLIISGKMVSADYTAMTLEVLARSGIKIKTHGMREYSMAGSQTFRGLKDFTVPSDYGLAAFLMGAALLNKSDIILQGSIDRTLVQADGRILGFLKKMGGRFSQTARTIRIEGPALLHGGHFSLKDCPDLVPIMAVLALFCRGETRLFDIGHARAKESDRIGDLTRELRKVGAHIKEEEGGMIIVPRPHYRPGCLLDSHRDHRLAMAFAVLGTKLGARIKDIECTAKSYPGFVRDFRALGAQVRLLNHK